MISVAVAYKSPYPQYDVICNAYKNLLNFFLKILQDWLLKIYYMIYSKDRQRRKPFDILTDEPKDTIESL